MVDYELHWGITSKQVCFTNKTVLDLGADNGSTAEFFLSNGARRVVSVEGNQKLALELTLKYKNSPVVVPIYMFISETSDLEYLILEYKPNIVKVDIEGWEKLLLFASRKVLSSVKEWMIEVHSDELDKQITKLFEDNGFSKSIIPYKCSGNDWVHYYRRERNADKMQI